MGKGLGRFFKERRGSVGAGFLIIALSMIMVSALVGQAFLVTSGTMGTQMETTSEKTTSRVSTYLRIIEVMGYTTYNETVSSAGSNITKIIVTTRLYSESNPVSYDDIILTYHSGDVYISGILFNDSVPSGTSVTEIDINTDNDIKDFEVVRVRDIIANEVLDPGETIEIHFWIEDEHGVDRQLAANKQFTLTLQPSNGQIRKVKKTTPATLASKYVLGLS